MAYQAPAYNLTTYGFGTDALFNVAPVKLILDSVPTYATVTVSFDQDQINGDASGQMFITGVGFIYLKQRQNLESLPDALVCTHLMGFDDSGQPCVLELVAVINDGLAVIKSNTVNASIDGLEFLPVSVISKPCNSVQLSATANTVYGYAMSNILTQTSIALTGGVPQTIGNGFGVMEPILIFPDDINSINVLCSYGT